MRITSFIKGIISGQLTKLLEGLTKDFSEEVKHTISNNILEYQVEEYNRNYYYQNRNEPKRIH